MDDGLGGCSQKILFTIHGRTHHRAVASSPAQTRILHNSHSWHITRPPVANPVAISSTRLSSQEVIRTQEVIYILCKAAKRLTVNGALPLVLYGHSVVSRVWGLEGLVVLYASLPTGPVPVPVLYLFALVQRDKLPRYVQRDVIRFPRSLSMDDPFTDQIGTSACRFYSCTNSRRRRRQAPDGCCAKHERPSSMLHCSG